MGGCFIRPSLINSSVDCLAFWMMAEARSYSSCLLGFMRATPCSIDFRAHATASLGKTSHSSILGKISFSLIPRSSA